MTSHHTSKAFLDVGHDTIIAYAKEGSGTQWLFVLAPLGPFRAHTSGDSWLWWRTKRAYYKQVQKSG